MAVAGFDDIPMARYMHPPLSTVRVNISALGERATRRLLDAVANGRQHQKRRETLPVTLVIRESCGGRGAAAAASPPPRGPPHRTRAFSRNGWRGGRPIRRAAARGAR